MSVTTQSNDPSATPPRYSSAEAYPLDPYPSKDSDSTSATRNDSSSSMTAIARFLDTSHPHPDLNKEARIDKPCMHSSAQELYKSVIAHFPRKKAVEMFTVRLRFSGEMHGRSWSARFA